jgi:plastocyanin
MKRISSLAVALVLMALVAVGCSKAEVPAAGKVQSGEVTVNLKNMKFVPNAITVKKGTKVTFDNKDAMLHDVLQIEVKQLGKEKPSFDSGEIMPGKSWTMTFDTPGTYPILCQQASHWAAGMTGLVTVVE